MKNKILALLIMFLCTTTTWAHSSEDHDTPATASELERWEKMTIAKAQNGDVEACRLLYLSNHTKFAGFGQHAIEVYEQQQTGEAYYHLAELYADDVELRDSLLRRSADMGYEPAVQQIEGIQKTALAYHLFELEGEPMRYRALDFDVEPNAADAPYFMEKAREYERIHHRREAIWYYNLAYDLDPNGCSTALERSNSLLNDMKNARNQVEQQLAQEEMQRQINSMQWQQLANSASQLANSLQRFQKPRQRTTINRSSTASTSSGKSSSTSTSRSTSPSSSKSSSSRTKRHSTSTLNAWHLEGERQCGTCLGKGQYNCWQCSGKGTIRKSGIDKNGKQVFTNEQCHICRGSGKVKCNSCGGKGKR
jgi:hypothetical protein